LQWTRINGKRLRNQTKVPGPGKPANLHWWLTGTSRGKELYLRSIEIAMKL
jgi:hypothetical protein